MKKFFWSLTMATIFLMSSVAFAIGFEETLAEDADLTSIKNLAVALPMHYKVEVTEPTAEEFGDIVSNAGRLSNLTVISYDDMVDNIWRDARVDIKALADTESRKIYNEHVAAYADAYVTATSANNNKYVQFFFEVRDAKSGDMMYVFSTQSRYYGKDLKGYTRACEDFYKQLNVVIEKQIKDLRKKKKS